MVNLISLQQGLASTKWDANIMLDAFMRVLRKAIGNLMMIKHNGSRILYIPYEHAYKLCVILQCSVVQCML